MECHDQDLLQAYLDDELDVARTIEMERHVAGCTACADAVAAHRALRDALASPELRFAPPPDLAARVRTALDAAASPRRATAAAAPRPWRWACGGAAVALASVLLVSRALVPGAPGREPLADELLASHVRSLMAAHLTDVASSDRHTVKPWFQGKLPFTFNLPDVETSPFKLIGGRLTYFQQSPGAQLLFEVGKHQISVFIFQNRAELSRLNSGSSLSRKLAFNTETWVDGGLWYFVLGDASPSDVHDLSELLKSANR